MSKPLGNMFISFRKKKKKSVAEVAPPPTLNSADRPPPYPARVGLDGQHTSPNDLDEASSAGSSMISLNPADITNSPKLRAVKLSRNQDGKFGISLLRGGDKHFVEGPGLYPQDRLIEVNGENVEGATNDRIYELFELGGSELTLVVQGLPEMAEINSRITPEQRDSIMSNSTMSLSSSEMQEEPWQHSRRVWYVHADGIQAGTILPSTAVTNTSSSTVLLRLDNGQRMIEVDEYDTEPANPPKYDRAENLASLLHLNESCVLHTLRQRFGSNLIHTQAANILLLVNPSRKLSVYNTKVMSMFRNMHYNKMPPHLYKTAKQAHLKMLATHTEQSIVLCGPTGSGKSTALHYIVHYYAQVHCNPKGGLPSEKFTAALALLDSFGCCLSESNTHSTRFTSLITLNFTAQGTLTGAQTYTCLLDRFRVVNCGEGELGYHIFYQMIEGSDDSLRRELQLGSRATENNDFLPPLIEHGQRKQAAENYAKTLEAFKFLGGVSIPEVKGLLTLLSAIIHLGKTGAVAHANGMGARFANPTAAQIAANVLGIKYEALERQLISTLPLSSDADPAKLLQNAIEDLAMSLYELVFSAVNTLINRALAGPGRSPYSLVLTDMPGFQNPARPATLQHLLMNYASERLQAFFQHETFNKVLDLYEQEEIKMNYTDLPASPKPVLDILDMHSQGRSDEATDTKGLYWILDEESMFPGATDITFLERVLMHHSDAGGRGYRLLHQSGPSKFVLSHCNHLINVEYDCTGWLQQARDTSAARFAKTIVQESTRQPVIQLFQGKGASTITKGSPTPKALADGTSTFMRQANSRKGHSLLSSNSIKPQNRCLNYKFQLDYVFDTLKRTNPHFIHCVTPRSSHRQNEAVMEIVHVRSQLRSTGILQFIRLYREGYPDCLSFADFRRQFEVLRLTPFEGADADGGDSVFDEREAVITILEDCELDDSRYRTGISKVFFKPGVLADLQLEKEQKLNNFVIALQSVCRGAIARKRVDGLMMKHSAVSVIQRNALIHAELQSWGWWKLFTRVKPLIKVHSAKDIERKEQELVVLRTKVSKLEEETNSLTEQNAQLTAKTEDLEVHLQEERENSAQAANMYQTELVDRRTHENSLAEFKEKYETLLRDNEKLRLEIEETKTTHIRSNESLAPSSGLGSEDDEQENTAQFWKQKYIQATADLESAKKSFETEALFAGDAVKQSVKQLERKLQEVEDEKEHQETLANNYKRAQQKQAEEIADLKVNLEHIQSRNSELERKQKRFDQEVAKVNHTLKNEVSSKEKLGKEKEALQTELISLKDRLRESNASAEETKRKLTNAESQLVDLTAQGLDTTDVAQLKKAKRDSEQKVDELEEELEEVTCQVSSLQSAKTKWEMEAGSLRAQLTHDNDAKEEEISTLRDTLNKRINSLQDQLEEEYTTSKTALKQKRELERRLADVQDSSVGEEEIRRVKKQLAKVKALYRESQSQLESRQSSSVNKSQLNNLKAQVEDLQDALSAAQRAKRSADSELSEVTDQLQSVGIAKMDAENRISTLQKQVSEAQSRVEEMEEEIEEAEKKNRLHMSELSAVKLELAGSQTKCDKNRLRVGELERQITDLQASLDRVQRDTADKDKVVSLENKIRELGLEVEMEQSQKTRSERTIKKLKDSLADAMDEVETKKSNEISIQNELRRLQRQLREASDAANDTETKDVEWNRKKREYDEQIEELTYERDKFQNQVKGLKDRLTVAESRAKDTSSYAVSDDDLLSDDIDDNFLDDDDDDYLLDDEDIELDVRDTGRRGRKALDTRPSRDSLFSHSPLRNASSRVSSSPLRNTSSRDSSPRQVRNGGTPPSSERGGGREGKRKKDRRRSRDGRTQGSITAADIAAARKIANEEDDR
ncbi:unconventional myosin-XVIIIa-like isoform X2 [Bolinopsis microptera]|uniref:unconventional myosin-XVIIIa-like isoform X2 n=1 Tax=Bolinopsis microptera TaxID=2820187 RepID=UPI003079CFD3